jgi:DNA-binding winged helix-turn-helix (wHTH) protein/TolB-like protein
LQSITSAETAHQHPQVALTRVTAVGRCRVDPSADEIEADGRVVKLEPQQMRLLLALAEQAGQVVTTQELLDRVWRDLIVTPNSVYQAVAQLRKQLASLGEDGEAIQTVHRKGYRLVAPVQVDEPANNTQLPVDAVLPGSPDVAPINTPGDAAAMPDAASPKVNEARLQRDRRRRQLLVAACSAAAVVGVGALWWRGANRGPAAAAALRIAVLPLTDRSAGAAEQALARGLTQDLTVALGHYADTDVLASESVLALGSVPATGLADAAQRLNARYLLVGDLVRTGVALRVSMRLVEPPAAEPIWRRDFRQPIEAASLLPNSIAREVAAALGLTALPTGQAGAGASEAYELYVLGTDAWRAKTPEAFAKAREYFQRGIDLDPGFARNYVGLGWTWLGQSGAGIDLPQAIARATPPFDRALALEPTSAETLTAQATLHRLAGEYEVARDLLQRAIAANRSYSQAHMTLGIVESDEGWPVRALVHLRRAALLNPLTSSPFNRLALAQVFAGEVEAGAASARRAIELEPKHPNGTWGLGMVGYATGDLVQAVGAYRRVLDLEPRRGYEWYDLARMYLDLGLVELASTAFARCAEQLPRLAWPPVHAAFAWVVGGDRSKTPPALSQLGNDGHAIEGHFILAMAGLPLEARALQRALDAAAALGQALTPEPWLVLQGHHRRLDLATVQLQVGRAADAAIQLDAAEQHLDRLTRQGNRFHTLHLHRARLHGLRGNAKAALDALEAAVAAGSRRGWWMRLDPAFASLQGDARLVQLLARLEDMALLQRRQLGLA